jgi:hypothetical protein
MRGRDLIVVAIGWLAISADAIAHQSRPTFCVEAGTETRSVQLTPSVIREIQFMLSRLGVDPGPIDGVVGAQTNRAIREFQQHAGLPGSDLINASTIPAELLAELRNEASRAILGETPKPQSSGSPAKTVAVPAPATPPADRFAACAFNPDDFRIGGIQYTPDKFLQVGFNGSTARAVASLKDRLDEARQLAENIGGPALLEVQRQAHVLNYFNCRLKIEEAVKNNK